VISALATPIKISIRFPCCCWIANPNSFQNVLVFLDGPVRGTGWRDGKAKAREQGGTDRTRKLPVTQLPLALIIAVWNSRSARLHSSLSRGVGIDHVLECLGDCETAVWRSRPRGVSAAAGSSSWRASISGRVNERRRPVSITSSRSDRESSNSPWQDCRSGSRPPTGSFPMGRQVLHGSRKLVRLTPNWSVISASLGNVDPPALAGNNLLHHFDRRASRTDRCA